MPSPSNSHMKKLDLTVNFPTDILTKAETASRTPQRLINLTSRADNENMAAGLVINSFRDARNRILKHKAHKNNQERSMQNLTLNESARKVTRLEAEWNNLKNNTSQTRPSTETSRIIIPVKKHAEISYDIKSRAERSDFSKRNESKYEASYFNEIDNKFEEELSSHKEASSATKPRISLPNLSLKSPKIQLSRFGNATPQSAVGRRDQLLSPKQLLLEEVDTSISKQKLHILGRILKKASIPNTTKATSPQEISFMSRTPKRETNKDTKDDMMKDIPMNFNKSQMDERAQNDEPNFVKVVDSHPIQPKLLKDNSYFNRRTSEENLSASLKQREKREKKEMKKIQRHKKDGVSPISIKVSLSNARDIQGKENRPTTDELHTPTMSTSRILNITPTNRTRVKSPLHDLMKSIERSINLEESKPKSVKIEPKKLTPTSPNAEFKTKTNLKLSKILRPETPQIKSVRVHFPETSNDGTSTPLMEKSGFQSQRGNKKEEEVGHNSIFKKPEMQRVKAEFTKMNERDKLYQHIIQRLNQEKA